MPLILAATGHRPNKLGGYSPSAEARLRQPASVALAWLKPDIVISGMAIGWDLAVAEAALDLGLQLTAAIPFPNQPGKWPSEQVARWYRVKKGAEVAMISTKYHLNAFQERNEWMVHRCDALLAMWDGSAGGTANCIRFAQTQYPAMLIHNLYPKWRTPHANHPSTPA